MSRLPALALLALFLASCGKGPPAPVSDGDHLTYLVVKSEANDPGAEWEMKLVLKKVSGGFAVKLPPEMLSPFSKGHKEVAGEKYVVLTEGLAASEGDLGFLGRLWLPPEEWERYKTESFAGRSCRVMELMGGIFGGARYYDANTGFLVGFVVSKDTMDLRATLKATNVPGL